MSPRTSDAYTCARGGCLKPARPRKHYCSWACCSADEAEAVMARRGFRVIEGGAAPKRSTGA